MWFGRVLLSIGVIALGACRAPEVDRAVRPAAHAEVPVARLEEGKLNALVYLPDARAGHYRGTRFDWTGMIGRLEYDGEVFWDEWNASDDPTGDHDNAVGPALEFGMKSPIGFDEAKPGEGFIKIGVGVLEKPADGKPYMFRRKYPILATENTHDYEETDARDQILFRSSANAGPYSYRLTKRVSVRGDTLTVWCQLDNTGTEALVTDVYNHNFFRPGARGFEPPTEVQFDRPATAASNAKTGKAVTIDGKITVTAAPTGSVWGPLEFPGMKTPRTFTLTKGRLKMTVTHDFEPSKYVLYGLAEFIAVEPFMDIRLAPGQRVTWSYTYRFHVQP